MMKITCNKTIKTYFLLIYKSFLLLLFWCLTSISLHYILVFGDIFSIVLFCIFTIWVPLILHEFGHLLIFHLLEKDLARINIKLSIFGLHLDYTSASKSNIIKISISGIVANIVALILTFILLYFTNNALLLYFIYGNFIQIISFFMPGSDDASAIYRYLD